MFCKNCGKETDENTMFCIHCGCELQDTRQIKKEQNESKTGIGVIMALFLGLIGLIIGIALYPAGSYERKTFLKAFGITYGVVVGIAILIYIIVMFSLTPYYYYY